MRTFTLGLLISSLVGAAAACQGDSNDPGDEEPAHASPLSRLIPQVTPPIDIKAPPEDAAKTASGLAVKKLTTRNSGAQARRGDTVMVHYTGWRQRTGETFFTTKGIGQPLSLDVEHAAPAFGEALQLLRKGEKAVLWVPPSESTPEALVYEIEVTEVVSPPQGPKQNTAAAGSVEASGRSDAAASGH
jgi:peptidylprolyl isomerase